MTIQKSVVLLSSTSNNYDVQGAGFHADSWYGYTDGLHTVSVTYVNLYGNFHLQGTLSTDEEDESSWFDIDINSTDNAIPYIEFNGESGINAFSFVGNFTFIRASLNRSERADLDPDDLNSDSAKDNQGLIEKVLLAI